MLRLIVLSLLLLSSLAKACEVDSQCIEQSNWQIGIALGLGARSNPLVDGDTMPMVVLPDIAWYGEAAYFDNGEIGYQFLNDRQYAAEVFASVDTERAFFSFWQPGNIFFSSDMLTSSLPSFDIEQQTPDVSINDVASRDWTINGGIRGHWYVGNSEWKVSWQQDIMNVHSGNKFVFGYSHFWQHNDWTYSLAIEGHWKSRKLLDYYYGLSFKDGVPLDLLYQAQSGWQPKISVGINRPINKRWQFVLRASYQRLNSGMYNSPLVDKKSVQSIFIGAAYRF